MGFLLCSVLVRDFYKDSRKLVCFVIYILLKISLFSCDNVKKSFFYYESMHCPKFFANQFLRQRTQNNKIKNINNKKKYLVLSFMDSKQNSSRFLNQIKYVST